MNKDYVYQMKHETYIAVRWLAPEGFDTVFSSKTDVWAFGVTVCEVFNYGGDPWGEIDDGEVRNRILLDRGPDKPREMPQSVYKVVNRCCQKNRNSRPTFKVLAVDLESVLKSLGGSSSSKKKSPSATSSKK